MFALGFRYLNDWAMATDPANRARAEWPPHPDRVFMALAAGHFETGDAGSEEKRIEREVLEWMEQLPPPALAASPASFREVVATYAPVNDPSITRRWDNPAKLSQRLAQIDRIPNFTKAKKAGLEILPEFRPRQSIAFPVAVPHDPEVFLIWPGTECPAAYKSTVASLCAKVTSLGEPSSLVVMWLATSPRRSDFEPDDGNVHTGLSLRVTGAGGTGGRLQRLEDHHAMEVVRGRRMPIPCDSMLYRPTAEVRTGASEPMGTAFAPDLIVLRRSGGALPGLESTLQVCEAFRKTLIKYCPQQPPPEWLSGHDDSGRVSVQPHLALFPLADVAHSHPRGHLLGLGIAVPRVLSRDDERILGRILLDPHGHPQLLHLHFAGNRVGMELASEELRQGLQSSAWTAAPTGATIWGTVTPIALDRHPKDVRAKADSPRVRAEKQAAYWREIESLIAESCEKAGAPRPIEVHVLAASPLPGAPSAAAMPRLARKDGGLRRQTHAVLRFPSPIAGPLLLGAGRFRGYGLCRPLPQP